jgi:hypothetical protein
VEETNKSKKKNTKDIYRKVLAEAHHLITSSGRSGPLLGHSPTKVFHFDFNGNGSRKHFTSDAYRKVIILLFLHSFIHPPLTDIMTEGRGDTHGR